MPDIKLRLVNQALTAAGEDPLDALVPGSPMANAAITNYDDFVDEELENGVWKFATKIAVPTFLTATVDKPLKYQWQRAADDIEVQAVLFRGRALEGEDYDIQGRVIRTRFNANITVKYTYRPNEEVWPRRFCRIIVQRLEALFLRSTERFSEATERDEDTALRSQVARHTESRQRNNTPLNMGSIAEARMGRRSRRPF